MESIRREVVKGMERGDIEDSRLDDRIKSFGQMMRDAMSQLSREIDAVTSANKRRRDELQRVAAEALRNFARRVDTQIEVHRRIDRLERYVVKSLSEREAVEASKDLYSLATRVASLQDRLIDHFKRNKESSPTTTSTFSKETTNEPSPRRRMKELDIEKKIKSLENRLERIHRQVMESNEQTLEILNSALVMRKK
jgi:hypothetical protein